MSLYRADVRSPTEFSAAKSSHTGKRPLYATAEQFEDFRIEDMAKEFRDLESRLWDLAGYLLSGEDADVSTLESGGEDDFATKEDEYCAAFGHDGIFTTTDAAHPGEKPETKLASTYSEEATTGLMISFVM
ncbi:hypothetical protein DAEQUDRAFT_770943 [Daedalea quercina L-15889]|uniref:Uncharacterized protein n=1 Tax=Daedalea quercina L-15889 TaxID=1314783 RepID=A0A165KFY9_9APHY|nr:hypothetical protein DAEQUDRAFT_770943 [Daedalea quercina L-15889]